MRAAIPVTTSLLLMTLAAACGDSKTDPNEFNTTAAGGSAGKGGGAAGKGGGGAAGSLSSMGGSAGAAGTTCQHAADLDSDGDGWTIAEGDCNDCDPNVNPGAIDVINVDPMTMMPLPDNQQVAEDCGAKPKLPSDAPGCDSGIKVGGIGKDLFDVARAIGLCNVGVPEQPADKKDKRWGVIAAKYSDIGGTLLATPPKSGIDLALQLGILDNFGPATKPQEGVRLFALSSGQARAEGHPGYQAMSCSIDHKIDNVNWPAGFPKKGTCSGNVGPPPLFPPTPHDGVAFDMKIRAPSNAKAFAFDFRFFTVEYPDFACSQFFDVFAVFTDPFPLPMSDPMWPDLAFENSPAGKNVIGVNNQSFLTTCDKGPAGYDCSKGPGDLKGTGFELANDTCGVGKQNNHGASSWLNTSSPITVVKGGDTLLSVRFAIWDTADGELDSTAVVDNFRFTSNEGTGVGTQVIPEPK